MKKTDEPIVIEQIFDTSIKSVWNSITVLAEMKQWYFKNIKSFEPRTGFNTNFIVEVEDRVFPHIWKVTEVVPMKKISYEWQFESYPGRGVSEFELFEMGYQTKLKLSYTVLEDFPGNIPEFERKSGVEGWNYFIKGNLKRYLEEKRK